MFVISCLIESLSSFCLVCFCVRVCVLVPCERESRGTAAALVCLVLLLLLAGGLAFLVWRYINKQTNKLDMTRK